MKKRSIFWGIGCILAAIFLIVCKLGLLGEIGFWSLLFTIFLAAVLIKGIFERNYRDVIFSIAFLLITYDKPLGIEELTPWTVLGAAVLVNCGLAFLFPKKNKKDYFYEEEWKKHRTQHNGNAKEVIIDIEENGYIKQTTKFGASTKYVNCDNFKQAELDCAFGAMTVYFNNAQVKDAKAYASIQVKFAGMELYIPKEWAVVNDVNTSLGAVEEKNRNCPDGKVTLVLSGSVNLGGVDIIYV